MTESVPPSASGLPALFVAAGEDRFGEQRGLGVSTIAFKVIPQDSSGLFILENTFHARGGPARHLHDICITTKTNGSMRLKGNSSR